MKLAGLIKEDINPYEDNTAQEKFTEFVKTSIQDSINNISSEMDSWQTKDAFKSDEKFVICTEFCSRGDCDLDILFAGKVFNREQVLFELKWLLDKAWRRELDYLDDQEDFDDWDDNNHGEFIGGSFINRDYGTGVNCLNVQIEEEGGLVVIRLSDLAKFIKDRNITDNIPKELAVKKTIDDVIGKIRIDKNNIKVISNGDEKRSYISINRLPKEYRSEEQLAKILDMKDKFEAGGVTYYRMKPGFFYTKTK